MMKGLNVLTKAAICSWFNHSKVLF